MLVIADTSALVALARLNGIEIIGSLGILLRAKEAGVILEIRPLIQAAGVHYGEQLVAKTLRLAGEL
jgi:uncharacterized protein